MSEPAEWIEIGGRRYTPDEFRAAMGDVNPFWLMEAIASVELDHDDRAQTYSLPAEPEKEETE